VSDEFPAMLSQNHVENGSFSAGQGLKRVGQAKSPAEFLMKKSPKEISTFGWH
jgi:hypothetical protein